MKEDIRGFLFCVYITFSCGVLAVTPELDRQLVGHGGPVNCVAISPDGKRLISGSLDYAVMLWEIDKPAAKPSGRFIAHRGAVSEVMFLPSGNEAVSGGDDGTLYLWDLRQQTLIHQFKGHQAKVVSMDVSLAGNLLASASWDGTLRVWDLAARKVLKEFYVHDQTVHAVLLSADGETVYSAGYDGRIRSWDVATGELIKVIHSHGWPINVMRWHPDHQRIVFGASNGDVQVLAVADERIEKILFPHRKPVLSLAVSRSHGLIATGGNDGVIRVWDSRDWSKVGETEGIPGPVWALDFTADGQGVYFGSLDDSINYWAVAQDDQTPWQTGRSARRFQVMTGQSLGEVQFARKCSVCHSLEPGETNRAGPSLHQVMGRKAGSLPEYPYSEGLQASKVIWNEETIEALFVRGPDTVVPGSKMPLQKIPDAEKRAALIEFLKDL